MLADLRIVVTGGAGFLGSFVVDKLRARGARDLFVVRSSEYDLIDIEAVRRLYRDRKPDLLIHLAGRVGGIGHNRANPGKFFYDNLMMGVHLLHEGMLAGLKKLLAVGTICSYPKFATPPFKEEDLWNGYPEETNAPYGLAKRMLLVQSQAYRQQYGFNSSVLFPVNLYGPRDNFDLETSHVIPALIHKIDAALRDGRDEVVLWGDGSPTREFLYVEDAAEGILAAAERYHSSEPLNLSCSREVSIKELAALLGELMRYRGKFIYDTSKPNGQPRRAVDSSRALAALGWAARTPLDEGLARTIDWWRSRP